MDDIARLGVAKAFLDFGGIDPKMTVEEAGAGLDGEGGHLGKKSASVGQLVSGW
jgi:hypothetical protein